MMDLIKSEFEPDLLREIEQCETALIQSGTVLQSEGSYIRLVPLVPEGSVRVRKTDESGREIVLSHIQPGESCILSITGCMNMKASKVEAVTEAESKFILLSAGNIRKCSDRYKSWRTFVQKLYYERLDVLLGLAAIVLPAAALIGWCPPYVPCRIRTRKAAA